MGALTNITRGIEGKCEKAAKELSGVAPEMKEKKLAELINKKVCKSLDKKALNFLAEELAKQVQERGAPEPPDGFSKVKGNASSKSPGSGSPSITIPLPGVDLGDKGKLELTIWGNPKDFKNADKGLMLKFKMEIN